MAETKHNKHDKTSVTGPYAYRKALGESLECVKRGEICADLFAQDVISFGTVVAAMMGKSKAFYLAACEAFYDDLARRSKDPTKEKLKAKCDHGEN